MELLFAGLELLKAVFADPLFLIHNHVVRIPAENARGLVFFEDDAILLNEDLDGVLCLKSEAFSCFYGKNDSSEFVYFSYCSE